MLKTVKDMYNITSRTEVPLLSSYNADFWSEYISNYKEFDNVFKSMFKSFRFYDQELEETDIEVTNNFIEVVRNWLRLNHKRYSELWRVNVVNDSEYSIIDNYDIKEEYTGNESNQSSTKEGQRTDVDNLKVGNQNTSDVNKVTAFNSNNENTKTTSSNATGTRNDVESFTKGEQTNITNHNMEDGHTMRRHGNIGVMTQTDVMERHSDYWKKYNFYVFIFQEINDQFLIV